MSDLLKIIPEIACPECSGDIEAKSDLEAECMACGKIYPIEDKFINLLDQSVVELAEEISVQDRVALDYENTRYSVPYAARYHTWVTKKMLEGFEESDFERVLDNGCGIGVLVDHIQKQNVVGLDISSEMLKRASARMEQLVLGNSCKLPFKRDQFSLVFSRGLLHHLTEPAVAVDEISRVLKPGGKFVLVDTNTSLISAVPRLLANHDDDHFSGDHQNLSKKKISKLLAPHFDIIECSYYGYLAYPLLGFPDLVNVFSKVPFPDFFEKTLMKVDIGLSKIPLLRTQSWGIMIKAVKR